jgi:hypothetical protein
MANQGSKRSLKIGPIFCPETSVIYYLLASKTLEVRTDRLFRNSIKKLTLRAKFTLDDGTYRLSGNVCKKLPMRDKDP